MTYDTDKLNIVAEKQLHEKITPRQIMESKTKLSVKQLECVEMHHKILLDGMVDESSFIGEQEGTASKWFKKLIKDNSGAGEAATKKTKPGIVNLPGQCPKRNTGRV